ncbi:hypothetical protein FIBSPDRAFT_1041121 [Athelia psychrophila]|uniref:Uncharacterized protein n=1 Tax=Athelia psychrophila TaxID=1759441 RepID=A0A166PGJ3_9AGAM|nr:hypothetical protein FIBSPDRAFT_1041121 [Fibularhizoctonia sp. CBS 109695]
MCARSLDVLEYIDLIEIQRVVERLGRWKCEGCLEGAGHEGWRGAGLQRWQGNASTTWLTYGWELLTHFDPLLTCLFKCLFRVASAASRSNLPPASSYLCRKNRHLELFDLSPGQRRERTGGPVREELEDRARRLLEARLVPPSAAGREGGGERRRVWMEERARVGVALVQVAEAVVYAGRVALAVADAERAIGRGGEAYTEAVSRGQKLTELTAPEAQSLGPTPSGHTLPGRMRARQGSLREPVRKHVRGRIILGVVLVPERVAGIRPHVPRQEAVRGLGTIGRAKSPVVKTFRPRLHEFPQSYSGGVGAKPGTEADEPKDDTNTKL